MGTGLFGFIFKTLRRRVNDPANAKYWLPQRLQELSNPSGPGKMLPLHGTNWNLGEVSGTSGSDFRSVIISQWWLVATNRKPQFNNQKAIPVRIGNGRCSASRR